MGDDLSYSVRQAMPSFHPAAGFARRASPLRPARVLLVDDSRGDLLLGKRCLLGRSGLGCELVTAQSSDEALDIMLRSHARAQPIDLVLLDINMPQHDGFVLLDHIRGHVSLRRTPAIMCTGSTHDLDRSHARLLGAVGYIVKPASLEGIRGVLESLPLFDVAEDEDGLRLMTVAPDYWPA